MGTVFCARKVIEPVVAVFLVFVGADSIHTRKDDVFEFEVTGFGIRDGLPFLAVDYHTDGPADGQGVRDIELAAAADLESRLELARF